MLSLPDAICRLSKALLFLACCSSGWCQVITSIAGTDWLFPGDGSMAINAPIGGSLGLDVATGPAGPFYIADADNQMVMSVGTDGILHVVAGNGFAGHWGDGGLAVNAGLFNASGVAADAAGNVYIAEYGGKNYGGTIRMVTPDGNINTIAGTGALGSAGDGGPAAVAILNRPYGVAVDSSGNIYFTEQGSGRIRKFTPGGSISTIAGGGKISGTNADGGQATDAILGGLTRLAVDAGGNVYFIDSALTIRRVTPGGILSTVAGGGQLTADGVAATQASILPAGIAVDAAGNLYIADYFASSIRKVTNGIISTLAGGGRGFMGDGGPALMASFNFPVGAVAVDASADVFCSRQRESANSRNQRRDRPDCGAGTDCTGWLVMVGPRRAIHSYLVERIAETIQPGNSVFRGKQFKPRDAQNRDRWNDLDLRPRPNAHFGYSGGTMAPRPRHAWHFRHSWRRTARVTYMSPMP